MNEKSITGHLIFWLSILAIGTATVYPYFTDIKMALLDRAIFLPVWGIATYLNWGLLMPRFLSKKKIGTYLLLLLGLILALTIAQRYLCLFWFYPEFLWNSPPDPAELQPFLPGKMIQFAAFISLPVICSIAIYLLLAWYRESYQARQIIARQQAAELNYLKAQINPHFLFNTLNNLYGLSLEESKKVPGMILKLSDILSYSLYESSVERISLFKEIKLIEDFIALEQERYGERMKVEFVVSEELDVSLAIAPLLLIPLVENAFKHGVKESTEAVPISIHLRKEGKSLVFEVKNEAPAKRDTFEKGGLGLKNLKRRLDLVYPDRHSFQANWEGELFRAKLNLNLDE